ncbi:MAG: hypothetical protein FWF28_04605 [Micrococcales bacterium]|nr:hypothetical protein [Micrococcales bacterium]
MVSATPSHPPHRGGVGDAWLATMRASNPSWSETMEKMLPQFAEMSSAITSLMRPSSAVFESAQAIAQQLSKWEPPTAVLQSVQPIADQLAALSRGITQQMAPMFAKIQPALLQTIMSLATMPPITSNQLSELHFALQQKVAGSLTVGATSWSLRDAMERLEDTELSTVLQQSCELDPDGVRAAEIGERPEVGTRIAEVLAELRPDEDDSVPGANTSNRTPEKQRVDSDHAVAIIFVMLLLLDILVWLDIARPEVYDFVTTTPNTLAPLLVFLWHKSKHGE